MWRLATILVIVLACATNAPGQGKVMFGNDSNHLFVLGSPLVGDPSGPIPASPLPSGFSLVAVLYAGTSAGSLSLQTSVVVSGTDWLAAGRMANKNVILTVPGGSPVYFQIFVMDTGATRPFTVTGGSGRDSFLGAIYFGTSGLFTAIPSTSITFANLANGASSTWAAVPLDAAGCLGCIPPLFSVNPSNSVVRLGHDVTLNALAWDYSFPGSVRYQWRKQYEPIAGATNAHLTLTNVTLADAGSYDVLASNAYGSTPSAVATVTVLVPAVLGSPAYIDNHFQFSVTGAPGTNYVVEVSTNLSNAGWLFLFTNTAPFTFIDRNMLSSPQKFYRAFPQ